MNPGLGDHEPSRDALEAVIDSGDCGTSRPTGDHFSHYEPLIVRRGAGDPSPTRK